MDGILNVYKEKGFTSHDVVAKLRGIFHQKKIGHTGTLDPDATGVLPVCLGKATKVCELLTDKDKTYHAIVQLGIVTDTQDTSGKILEEHEVEVTFEQIQKVASDFVGDLMQIPPMYSAIKVNGKKLYELARAGQEIKREPRKIQVFSLELGEYDEANHTFEMNVHCGKGTYIRTICHDIGQALGCGGAMKELVRTRVSSFTIESAKTLSEIEEALKVNYISILAPVDSVFMNLPSGYVKQPASLKRLMNGNQLFEQDVETISRTLNMGERVRIYDLEDKFIAIYEFKENGYYPVKMFL